MVFDFRRKFPLFSLTRRQALAGVASVALGPAATSGEIRKAALLTLKKNNEREQLVKMALTNDHVFAVWSTAITKGPARLACYGLDGEMRWSLDLGSTPVFALFANGDGEVTIVVIDRGSASVMFAKFSSLGALNQKDRLPLNTAILAAGANSTHICALDVTTRLALKRFGHAETPTQLRPAFDNPTIGGVTLRAIMASAHFLGGHLLLLDHVQARTVTILPNGEQQRGQITHPLIDAAVAKQDQDVAARASTLRSMGAEHTLTFPTSISLAASDRTASLWLICSLNTGNISVYRVDSTLAVRDEYKIQIPADSAVADRPPLMLAASQSTVALGFREGVVALADCTTV